MGIESSHTTDLPSGKERASDKVHGSEKRYASKLAFTTLPACEVFRIAFEITRSHSVATANYHK
jgi:hypothetical protein